MHVTRIAAAGGAALVLASGAFATTGAAATSATVTGVTRVEGGTVVLRESGGPAHRVRGVVPAVQNALVALAGRTVTVYGTYDRPSIPNSPILVQQFRVLPGGALNGESVSVTGPTRMLADGTLIVVDPNGNGHRLRATSAVGASTIAALAGKVVTVHGTASVTNPASYVNWPIMVQSIAASG